MRAEILGRHSPGDPLPLPLLLSLAECGFPSPADDYVDCVLDLNDLVVKNPTATYFVRARGDSMRGAGIHDGDILVVDRAREVESGDVVVAVLNGEMTVKRVRVRSYKGGRPESLWLAPENEEYPPIPVTEGMDFEVWGVVVASVHLHTRERAGRAQELVARAWARFPHGDGREGEPPQEPA